MYFAVRGGHVRIAELLLQEGADLHIKNRAGDTAMDVPSDASPLVRFGAETLRRWVSELE